MTIEKFHGVWHAQPFCPFRIHMADGTFVSVQHPDFVARSPSGRTVIVEYGNDRHTVIDLLLVTKLEVDGRGIRKAKSARNE